MKTIKKLMQIALAVFFFGLLATSAVLADDADSEGWQFVQENGRTYYKKGDIKETDWRVIDGKTYYFDYNGEMVVGWQYIPMPVKGYTIGPYPNGIRLEGSPMPEWYYFDKNGVLQEFVGWKALEVKLKTVLEESMGKNVQTRKIKKRRVFTRTITLIKIILQRQVGFMTSLIGIIQLKRKLMEKTILVVKDVQVG